MEPTTENFHKQATATRNIFMFTTSVLSVTTILFAVLWLIEVTDKNMNVLVMSQDGVYKAVRNDDIKNIITRFDMKKHGELYMANMWGHSATTYEERTNYAANLAIADVAKQHLFYLESNNRYDNYVKDNFEIEAVTDSAKVLRSVEPYQVLYYGKYKGKYANNSQLNQELPWMCKMTLIETGGKNEDNPHGLLIIDHTFVSQEDLQQTLGQN